MSRLVVPAHVLANNMDSGFAAPRAGDTHLERGEKCLGRFPHSRAQALAYQAPEGFAHSDGADIVVVFWESHQSGSSEVGSQVLGGPCIGQQGDEVS